jgi:hypothetical protein
LEGGSLRRGNDTPSISKRRIKSRAVPLMLAFFPAFLLSNMKPFLAQLFPIANCALEKALGISLFYAKADTRLYFFASGEKKFILTIFSILNPQDKA